MLKLSPDAVARQAETSQIPGRQVEDSWRFLLSALKNWLGQRDSKAIFLEQAGAFKDDESMDELVAQVYASWGRPEVESKARPKVRPRH